MAVLEPGVPTAIFTKLIGETQRRGRIALTPVADEIVKQVKANLAASGRHVLGTPTPASPGGPPAMISKTLRASIARSEVVRTPWGYLCQVGTAERRYPTYRSRKSASQYGRILELDGCRDGSRYPFLYATAVHVFEEVAPVIYGEMYGSGWARVDK